MKKLLISLFAIMCFAAKAQRMLVLPDTPRFANQNKGVFVLRTADNLPYYSNGYRWVSITAGAVTPSTINDSLNAYNLRNVTSYNGLRGAVRGADTIYLNSSADTLKWRIAGIVYSAALGSGGGAGITDGNKGDITVSSSGSNWKINDTIFTNSLAEFGKTIKTYRPVSAPYSSTTNSKFGLNVITDEDHRTYIQDGQIVLKNNFPFIAFLGKNNEIVNSIGYDTVFKHAYIDMRSNIDFALENNSQAWLYNIGSQSSLFPSKYWGLTAMCGGNQNLVVGYPFFGDPGMPTDKEDKLTVYGGLKVADDTFKLKGKFFANSLPALKTAKQLFWNPTDSTISIGDSTGVGGSGGVASVTGTPNRLTSTGGANPVLDISTTFEDLFPKTVSNGLTRSGANITLGSSSNLSQPTEINVDGSGGSNFFTLKSNSFFGNASLVAGSSGGASLLQLKSNDIDTKFFPQLYLSPINTASYWGVDSFRLHPYGDGFGNALIFDTRANKRGLMYAANYHSTLTARSLVDKGYVDSLHALGGGGGGTWGSIGGTIGAQADLQAALNQKLNAVDTVNKWIQNLQFRNDSILYVKNGTETLLYKFPDTVFATRGALNIEYHVPTNMQTLYVDTVTVSKDGILLKEDFLAFLNKMDTLIVTTTGTGAATFNPATNTLNIPTPSGGVATGVAATGGLSITSDGESVINDNNAEIVIGGFPNKPVRFIVNNIEKARLSATNGNLMLQNGGTFTDNGSRLQTTSFSTGYLARTAAYTLTATDHTVNYTSGTVTATLPTAVGCTGREYVIKNSGTGNITVGTTSSQTIDGATTYALATQYKFVHVQSNGANWIIIGNN